MGAAAGVAGETTCGGWGWGWGGGRKGKSNTHVKARTTLTLGLQYGGECSGGLLLVPVRLLLALLLVLHSGSRICQGTVPLCLLQGVQHSVAATASAKAFKARGKGEGRVLKRKHCNSEGWVRVVGGWGWGTGTHTHILSPFMERPTVPVATNTRVRLYFASDMPAGLGVKMLPLASTLATVAA